MENMRDKSFKALTSSIVFTQFAVQTPAINALREKVRFASDANNPQVLMFWLNAEQALVVNADHSCRQLYQAQFYLLLDAINDTLLPSHWRALCLDNIYQPLLALQRLSDCTDTKKQLRHLWLELNITRHYFL
ncbi:hypothetical protein GCM10009111_28420 [Colwellia asteriadis]|uniref:Uncharacterized protein n=1 Tax=Colwellia asteriadis TaxID=517723 RepID=A0ABN1L9R2_9GAMM